MERKNWLDWMKVIGMFTIILGHLFPNGIVPFVYSFSVPLFFVISGFLTNINFITNGKIYFEKLFKGLIIPYTLIWALNVLVYAVIARQVPSDIFEKVMGFVFGLEAYIGALWFIYTLILLKVITFLIAKIINNNLNRQLGFLLLTIIGIFGMYLINNCNQDNLINPVTTCFPDLQIMFHGRIASSWVNILCAMPFFSLGIFLRQSKIVEKYIQKLEQTKISILIASAISLSLILYPLAELNGEMFMYDCGYGNSIPLCYFNAIIGFFAVLLVSIAIKDKLRDYIVVLASGSILVLGFHGIPLNLTMLLFPGATQIGGEILGGILFAVILYLAFFPFIKLVRKYFPIMMGYRKVYGSV